MEPKLANVIEASVDINALVGFVPVQIYRLKGFPLAISERQVFSILLQRKAKYAILRLKNIYFCHGKVRRRNSLGRYGRQLALRVSVGGPDGHFL